MTASFNVFQSDKNYQHYFNLKAANGEIILQSEGYLQRNSALNGVESVQANAEYDSRYAKQYSSDNRPYFVLKASNGQVIGVSQMYSSMDACNKGIESVKRNAPVAIVNTEELV